MTEYPVIQLTFQNSLPGRFPGEIGYLSNTVIQFLDRDGQMVALGTGISKDRRRSERALEKALGSRGMTQWFWFEVRAFNERNELWLLEKARSYVMQLLKGSLSDIALKMYWQTTSSQAHNIELRSEAERLRTDLKSATRFWFIVLKSS